ncbi:MAG: hypothetical protein ACREU1_00405, partial [Burkholderiales bacterium]
MKGLLALGVMVFALAAKAAPFAVQLGDTRIGLDAPPGFADTGFTGSPRLLELAEALTSASNRILLFAIADGDLRRFTQGDPLELRRHMMVVTPRGLERERVSESAFRLFVAESLRGLGEAPKSLDFPKHLDARPTGTMALLAELRKEADVVSVLQGTRTKDGGMFGRSQYMLSTSTLLLVRGRALSLSVYTRYEDPADLDWIRATTARWVDELKRLN